MEIIGDPERVFPIFFAVWVALGAASFYFLYVSKDVERKKKLFRPFLAGTSVLFLGFMWAMGFPLLMLAIAAPMVALIMYLNSRMIRFCDACGRTIMQQMPFSPPKHCSHCGAALQRS